MDELIGGVDRPASLIRHAMVEGKSVVTAKEEVFALHCEEFVALAEEHGVGFHFEGAKENPGRFWRVVW